MLMQKISTWRAWDSWCKSIVVVTPRVETQHRSEEHTSELQSRLHLVCRLLLEKKKTNLRINLIGTRAGSRHRRSANAPQTGTQFRSASTPPISTARPPLLRDIARWLDMQALTA